MRTSVIGENDAMCAQDQWSGNYYDDEFNDINRNIVTCTNINNNGEVEHAQPQTGSLTVKKEVFGCETQGNLDCHDTDIESQDWLSCDDSPITSTEFCNLIRDNLDLFDIEVLDYQNNPIQKFTGSQQGTKL